MHGTQKPRAKAKKRKRKKKRKTRSRFAKRNLHHLSFPTTMKAPYFFPSMPTAQYSKINPAREEEKSIISIQYTVPPSHPLTQASNSIPAVGPASSSSKHDGAVDRLQFRTALLASRSAHASVGDQLPIASAPSQFVPPWPCTATRCRQPS